MTARSGDPGTVTSVNSPTPVTPAQARVRDALILPGTRAAFSDDLIERLERRLFEGTAAALCHWGQSRMFLTKHKLVVATRCEGCLFAESTQPYPGMSKPAAIGNVAHKAIQLSHTHTGISPAESVRTAVDALMQTDDGFREYWVGANAAIQSDVHTQSVSFTTTFLDSFPPLLDEWAPRFEEPIQARVGRLVLSSRPDLVIGRADDNPGLLLIDLKTGQIRDEHDDEAAFYALAAALRYRLAPWRSTVYSLASGEWTEAAVTEEQLVAITEKVVAAAVAQAEVLTGRRPPVIVDGADCRFCAIRTAKQ
jgi:hypothetical protein